MLPILANCLVEQEDASDIKSNTDNLEPNLPERRTERLDPSEANDNAERALPKRPLPRKERELPNAAQESTEAMPPNLATLLKLILLEKVIAS